MATAFKKGLPTLTEKDIGCNSSPRPAWLVCASTHSQAPPESKVSCSWHLSIPHLLHGYASSWFQEQAINKLFPGWPCLGRFSCLQAPLSTIGWNSLIHSTTSTSVFCFLLLSYFTSALRWHHHCSTASPGAVSAVTHSVSADQVSGEPSPRRPP